MPLEENKLMELPQTDQARDVPLIKSKERVQKHGEVFTPDWMVRKMLSYPEIQENFRICTPPFWNPAPGKGPFDRNPSAEADLCESEPGFPGWALAIQHPVGPDEHLWD